MKFKIEKKVYALMSGGKIKVVNVISNTKLPDGKECMYLDNFGYCIFIKSILEKGGDFLCDGLGALKLALKNKLDLRRKYLEKEIVYHEKLLKSHTEELKQIAINDAVRNDFIANEELLFKKERDEYLNALKNGIKTEA